MLHAGVRAPVDVALCMEVVAFKLLLSFHSSCVSDFKSKVSSRLQFSKEKKNLLEPCEE